MSSGNAPSGPAASTAGSSTTLPELYHRRAAQFADRVAVHSKDPVTGRWIRTTWRDGATEVRRLSNGLLSLGIAAGDRVAIISETRREWVQADLAIICSGGITVGIYPTSTAAECAFVLEHSGARVAFVEDADQLRRLRAAPGAVERLDRVILFDGSVRGESTPVLQFADLMDRGDTHAGREPDQYEARWRAVTPDDLAMLVYTSGTTGPPKGVMLTHRNVIRTIEAVSQVLPQGDDDLSVVFLPLSHSLQRVAGYAGIHAGGTGVFAERLDRIVDHMQEFHPTVQPAVPRVYEKVHARIQARVAESSPARRRLFSWAVDIGRQVSRLKRAGHPVPLRLAVEHRVADRLVLQRIRDVFGGRIRYMISGAAPISVELLEFFHACGLLVLEGWGLTETTAPATVNRPGDFRFGTVGRDLPICESRIAEDGEILVRGDNVFRGYWRDEDATRAAFTEDGWFRTGDIGEKDAQGFLRITDRKKELIITAAGKNISPANVERLVRNHPLVSQCVVQGDRRRFLVALISLDREELLSTAERLHLGMRDPVALAGHARIIAEVQLAIDTANRELARYETIKHFRILERELSVEDDLLTPTLKLKRRNIAERYAHLIEEMYRNAAMTRAEARAAFDERRPE